MEARKRSYRTECAPTEEQTRAFLQHAGCARFAYNWGLERKKTVMDLNRLPIERIKLPTAIDLHKEINSLKPIRYPWMYESSKCAPQEALRDLDRAFINFFEGRASFPKRRKRKDGLSFRLTGAIQVEPGRIRLPRIGWVRLKENGYLPSRKHINSATVSERGGRWFISLNVVEKVEAPESIRGEVVGVDRGISKLAVVSDGTVFENPRAYAKMERKLKRHQRGVSRKKRGSNNRRKAVQTLKKLHFKIANVRKDALHKATTWLAKNKPVIIVEDLAVKEMMSNRRLAKSIADVSWSEFLRQLRYKTEWYGSKLIVADRFYPSTKMCSGCGHVKDGMSLSERTYRCDACGREIDRDLNAAINLSRWPGAAGTLETPVRGGRSQAPGPVPAGEAGTTSPNGSENLAGGGSL